MNKRTVLLVNPPTANLTLSTKGNKNINAEDIQCYPPVNLLYLASSIKRARKDVDVKVVDYLVQRFSKHGFFDLLKETKPLFVGVTCYSTDLVDAFNIFRFTKEYDPEIPTVAGGPHTYVFPKETAEQPFIDYVCQGEGERLIVTMTERLMAGDDLDEIDNLWVKKNNLAAPPKNYNQLAFADIDSYPVLDQSFLNIKNYFHPFLYGGKGLITVMTTRGCPFNCTFCNSSNRVPRMRSISKVLDEIGQNLERYDTRNVFILDDTFNINRQRLKQFCNQLMARNLSITWGFRGRVNSLDDESILLAKKAGLVHISMGVEDFTDEGLRKIRKGTSVRKIKSVFAACNKYNVKTTANFIVGLPHNQEYDKQIKLLDFIKEISPTTIQTFVLMLIPGSALYNEAIERGIISRDAWLNHVKSPDPNFSIPGWEERMSSNEQFALNSLINSKYYWRPKYLAERLFEVRSLGELKTKLGVGFRLLATHLRRV